MASPVKHGLLIFGFLWSATLYTTPTLATPKALAHSRQATQVQALKRLGYQTPIAKKIVAGAPKLAAQVIKAQSKPITLYRGMDIEPLHFDPKFRSTDPVGKLCLSNDRNFALDYAVNRYDTRVRQGEGQAVLLEMQVPALLLDSKEHFVVHLLQNRQLDIAPLIVKFGTINLKTVRFGNFGVNSATVLRTTRWSSYP